MPKNRPHLDWSRPLPRTLIIPKVMTLATLDDVRALMRHLPYGMTAPRRWGDIGEPFATAGAGGGDGVRLQRSSCGGPSNAPGILLAAFEYFLPQILALFSGYAPPLPPPWSVLESGACFTIIDRAGQKLAYVYFEDEPGRQAAAGLLTRDEARRIADCRQTGRLVRTEPTRLP